MNELFKGTGIQLGTSACTNVVIIPQLHSPGLGQFNTQTELAMGQLQVTVGCGGRVS